jgi:hypothetical protein
VNDTIYVLLLSALVACTISFTWIVRIRGFKRIKVDQDEEGRYFELGSIGTLFVSGVFSVMFVLLFIELPINFLHIFVLSFFGSVIGLLLSKD